MTASPVLRPRCRPDHQQVLPTVAGAATLASLVLTSLVLGPPLASADDTPVPEQRFLVTDVTHLTDVSPGTDAEPEVSGR